MRRREVLLAFLALVIAPARAQEKLPRIAIIEPSLLPGTGTASSVWDAMAEELRRLGYAEGKSIVIQRWSGRGAAREESYKELAKKVVAARPTVIVVPGRTMFFVAAETTTIPIIAVASFPPELQARRARPDGNLTGIDMGFDQQQLYAKQVEVFAGLFKPGARVAWLGTKTLWDTAIGDAARRGAKASRLVLHPVLVAPVNELGLRQAFIEIAQAKVEGVFISPATEIFPHRQNVARMAIASGLPALGPTRYWAEAGTVLSYGVDYEWAFRRVASMIDKILKGAVPSSIPIEVPTGVELTVNLKTARALNLKVPQLLMQRADRVIE